MMAKMKNSPPVTDSIEEAFGPGAELLAVKPEASLVPSAPNLPGHILAAIEEAKALKETAERNLYEIPSATRAGWACRQQQAKDQLGPAMNALEDMLFPSYVQGLILGGPEVSGRRLDPKDVEPFLVVDADVYAPIARHQERTMGFNNPTFGVNQHINTGYALEKLAEEEGVAWKNYPGFREARGETPEQIEGIVRGLARQTVGDQIVTKRIKRETVRLLMAMAKPPARVQVVVRGIAPEEQPAVVAIFSKSAVHFPSSKAITKDDITKAFNSI